MNVNGKEYPIYIYFIYYGIYWLVVDLLKNMSSSVGMMTFPTEWKNNPNVPNHQPVYQHVRKTVVSTDISSIVFSICWGPNGHGMGFSNVSWHKNRRTFWNILESVDVAPLILRFLGFVSTICDRIAPFPLSYHPQRNHGLVGDKELSLGPWDKGVLH
jgi:hypothetical protein